MLGRAWVQGDSEPWTPGTVSSQELGGQRWGEGSLWAGWAAGSQPVWGAITGWPRGRRWTSYLLHAGPSLVPSCYLSSSRISWVMPGETQEPARSHRWEVGDKLGWQSDSAPPWAHPLQGRMGQSVFGPSYFHGGLWRAVATCLIAFPTQGQRSVLVFHSEVPGRATDQRLTRALASAPHPSRNTQGRGTEDWDTC